MILGAHESIAGGVTKAIDRGIADHAQSIQIFTKNVRGWNAKPLEPHEVQLFRKRVTDSGMRVIAHAAYLVNLGSEKNSIREKSIAGFIDELERCAALGVPFLVLHPGSNPELQAGIKLITTGLDEGFSAVKAPVKVLLEITAGQGSSIGHRFEHLSSILEGSRYSERIGICLDTCHMFAAGYDIVRCYQEVMDDLDGMFGTNIVQAIHLNDSKKGLGSQIDRHEEIGKGTVGLNTFNQFLIDSRFEHTVGVLETPQPEHYQKTLDLLRSLR